MNDLKRKALVSNIFYKESSNETISFNLQEKSSIRALITYYGETKVFRENLKVYEALLSRESKNVFIFSFDEREEGFIFSQHILWEIENKNYHVNQEILQEFLTLNCFKKDNKALELDHKIEICLNFLHNLNKKINIIPIIIGKNSLKNVKNLTKIIAKELKKDENVFIFLSFYLAKERDRDKLKLQESKLESIVNLSYKEYGEVKDMQKSHKINLENITAFLVFYILKKEYSYSLKIDAFKRVEIDKNFYSQANITIEKPI